METARFYINGLIYSCSVKCGRLEISLVSETKWSSLWNVNLIAKCNAVNSQHALHLGLLKDEHMHSRIVLFLPVRNVHGLQQSHSRLHSRDFNAPLFDGKESLKMFIQSKSMIYLNSIPTCVYNHNSVESKVIAPVAEFIADGPILITFHPEYGGIRVVQLSPNIISPQYQLICVSIPAGEEEHNAYTVVGLNHVESVYRDNRYLCVLQLEMQVCKSKTDSNTNIKPSIVKCTYCEWVVFDVRELLNYQAPSSPTAPTAQKNVIPCLGMRPHSKLRWEHDALRTGVGLYELPWAIAPAPTVEGSPLPCDPSGTTTDTAIVAIVPQTTRAYMHNMLHTSFRTYNSYYGVTCTSDGLLRVMADDGHVHVYKQLPLLKPIEARRMVVLPGEEGCVGHLLVVFCASHESKSSPEAPTVASRSDNIPFALVFRLQTLEFLIEMKHVTGVKCGYFVHELVKHWLWLPDKVDPEIAQRADNDRKDPDALLGLSRLPTLTSAPNMHGAMLLNMDGSWKHVPRGSAAALHLNKRRRVVPSATVNNDSAGGATAVSKAATTDEKVKTKRKHTTVGSTANSEASPDFEANKAFTEMTRSKQQAVLAALLEHLNSKRKAVQELQAIRYKKQQEIAAVRIAVSDTLRMLNARNLLGNFKFKNRSQSTCNSALKSILLAHKPLFAVSNAAPSTSLLHDNLHISPAILNATNNNNGIAIRDCICLCDDRSYSLQLIARCMNLCTLPVFDVCLVCSLSPRLGSSLNQSRTFSMRCITASAALVMPQQEVWISARIALSPLIFANLANASGNLLVNVGVTWKQLSMDNNSGALENAYENIPFMTSAFLDTIINDPARAIFEVRNGYVRSVSLGNMGATVHVAATDMHAKRRYHADTTGPKRYSQAMNEIQTRRYNCPVHITPFLTAKVFPAAMKYIDLEDGVTTAEYKDTEQRFQAKATLRGWLEGCAIHNKPMPSVYSQWKFPAGGIKYYSCVPTVSAMLVSTMAENHQTSQSTSMSPLAIMEWLIAQQAQHSPLKYLRAKSLQMDTKESQESFLNILPEVSDVDAGYSNGVVIGFPSEPPVLTAAGPEPSVCATAALSVRLSTPLQPLTIAHGDGGISHQQRAMLQLGITQFAREIPKETSLVLLWATEERLSKLRLAALMMIEDLKAWAVACRLHRLRQMESRKVFLAPSTARKGVASNIHTVQMNTDIHSTHTLHPLKNVSTEGHLLPNMPVQLGKAVTATPAVAAFCREKRLQADVAIALALEACDAVAALQV